VGYRRRSLPIHPNAFGAGVLSVDVESMGKADTGWSPVSLFRKATIYVLMKRRNTDWIAPATTLMFIDQVSDRCRADTREVSRRTISPCCGQRSFSAIL
jgi:hypothetical protein